MAQSFMAAVQKAIDDHLTRQERRLEEIGPELGVLLDGCRDLLVGGKRLRAAFCYWAWRGAGGADCPEIVVAASGLVLRRGHELAQVLKIFDRKLLKALAE